MVSNMPGSIAHDELPTVRNVFSEPYKKERHDSVSYGLTNDLPASIFADPDGHKSGSILNLSIPTAFQVNSSHIDMRIFAG